MGFVVARPQCTRFYQPWAVKYDSQQRSIATYVDVAADNVLFRLSPDAANRDPALGGLVGYKVRIPSDRMFHTSNTHSARIERFLDGASTKPAARLPPPTGDGFTSHPG